MHSETSSYSGQMNDDCRNAVLGNQGALEFEWLHFHSMAVDCLLAILWELIALFEAVDSLLKVLRFSLFKLFSACKLVDIFYFQIIVLVDQTYI